MNVNKALNMDLERFRDMSIDISIHESKNGSIRVVSRHGSIHESRHDFIYKNLDVVPYMNLDKVPYMNLDMVPYVNIDMVLYIYIYESRHGSIHESRHGSILGSRHGSIRDLEMVLSMNLDIIHYLQLENLFQQCVILSHTYTVKKYSKLWHLFLAI
jgi:hypothetical protein